MNILISIIDNKYTILKKSGAGRDSTVYKVKDLQGEIFALKLLDNVSTRKIIRLKKEFRILKKLKHENVISVFDFGYDSTQKKYYYTSEYFSGGDLSKLDYKSLSNKLILQIIFKILNGLAYLECNKLIHYDIKPKNIVFNRSNLSLKITDFGLSEVYKENSNHFAGTYTYMAPEILSGAYPVSMKSDIYSAGVVLYYLITGSANELTFPFASIVKNSRNSNNNNVLKVIKGLTENPFQGLLLKMLDYNPEFRASAKECLEYLNRKFNLNIKETEYSSYSIYKRLILLRKNELSLLKNLYKKKLHEKGFFYLLNGEEGMGKAMFLDELKTYYQLKKYNVLYLNIPKNPEKTDDLLNLFYFKHYLGIHTEDKTNSENIRKKPLILLIENFENLYSKHLDRIFEYLFGLYRTDKVFFLAALDKNEIRADQLFYFSRMFKDKHCKFFNFSDLNIEDIRLLVETFYQEVKNTPYDFYKKILYCSANNITKANSFIQELKDKCIKQIEGSNFFINLEIFEKLADQKVKSILKSKARILSEDHKKIFTTLSQFTTKVEVKLLSETINSSQDNINEILETLPDDFKCFIHFTNGKRTFIEICSENIKKNFSNWLTKDEVCLINKTIYMLLKNDAKYIENTDKKEKQAIRFFHYLYSLPDEESERKIRCFKKLNNYCLKYRLFDQLLIFLKKLAASADSYFLKSEFFFNIIWLIFNYNLERPIEEYFAKFITNFNDNFLKNRSSANDFSDIFRKLEKLKSIKKISHDNLRDFFKSIFAPKVFMLYQESNLDFNLQKTRLFRKLFQLIIVCGLQNLEKQSIKENNLIVTQITWLYPFVKNNKYLRVIFFDFILHYHRIMFNNLEKTVNLENFLKLTKKNNLAEYTNFLKFQRMITKESRKTYSESKAVKIKIPHFNNRELTTEAILQLSILLKFRHLKEDYSAFFSKSSNYFLKNKQTGLHNILIANQAERAFNNNNYDKTLKLCDLVLRADRPYDFFQTLPRILITKGKSEHFLEYKAENVAGNYELVLSLLITNKSTLSTVFENYANLLLAKGDINNLISLLQKYIVRSSLKEISKKALQYYLRFLIKFFSSKEIISLSKELLSKTKITEDHILDCVIDLKFDKKEKNIGEHLQGLLLRQSTLIDLSHCFNQHLINEENITPYLSDFIATLPEIPLKKRLENISKLIEGEDLPETLNFLQNDINNLYINHYKNDAQALASITAKIMFYKHRQEKTFLLFSKIVYKISSEIFSSISQNYYKIIDNEDLKLLNDILKSIKKRYR